MLVLTSTNNALSVTAAGICTAGSGGKRTLALQRVVRCWSLLVWGLKCLRCRVRRVEREPTRVSAVCHPNLPPTCLHRQTRRLSRGFGHVVVVVHNLLGAEGGLFGRRRALQSLRSSSRWRWVADRRSRQIARLNRFRITPGFESTELS
jgi:hypothetical protein